MSTIPDDVRRFVLASIPSVPYLEAALLFRERRADGFDVADIARALYLPTARAEEVVEALRRDGLLDAVDGAAARYRYAPRDDALAAAMDRLAEAYPKNLIAISQLIHASSGANARRFAEAFKLRKDS